MANTTYLKNEVEPFLRQWAERQVGVTLEKRRVVVGKTAKGKAVSYEFDGVSRDGTVGMFISSSMSYKPGQMRKYFMEATILNRVAEFRRRIMVFINGLSVENFKNQCDGLADLDQIEFLVCPQAELPAEMLAEIKRIYEESAKEVGDKSGPGKKQHGARG